MQELVCAALTAFIVVLFIRAVLSWFPLRSGTFMAQVAEVARALTDWATLPMRRIIPPVGMFDLSFFILVFFLFILRDVVCRA